MRGQQNVKKGSEVGTFPSAFHCKSQLCGWVGVHAAFGPTCPVNRPHRFFGLLESVPVGGFFLPRSFPSCASLQVTHSTWRSRLSPIFPPGLSHGRVLVLTQACILLASSGCWLLCRGWSPGGGWPGSTHRCWPMAKGTAGRCEAHSSSGERQFQKKKSRMALNQKVIYPVIKRETSIKNATFSS